jgi:hypothetical protein
VLPVDAEALVGVWLRPVRNPPNGAVAREGLRFLPEGIVHLIGIYSMNGLTWQLEGDRLKITTNTERYPEPQPLHYRVTRLDAGSLVVEGSDYLAGSYDRAATAPAEPLPASRAAAIAANLEAYRKVSGRLSTGDATAIFDAYYRDTTLRYIDEHVDQGDYGSTRNEYFLDSSGLFYYRSQSDLAAQLPERSGERERKLLVMAFDETGRVGEAYRIVDGETTGPKNPELAAPMNRLNVLLEALQRLKTNSPGK